MIQAERDTHFMQEALKEAKLAYDKGNVPIGAILVINDSIVYTAGTTLSRAYQELEQARTLSKQFSYGL